MTLPCMRDERQERADMIGFYRRKFHNGARYALPHRIDRLVHDGGKMSEERDYDRLWRALTDAIWCQREAYRRGRWTYDWNKHIGLHQARTWLRRERAAQRMEKAA